MNTMNREVGENNNHNTMFPLPLLEMPYEPSSRSRRIWQRYQHACNITTIANRTITSLNSLSCSFHSQARNLFSSSCSSSSSSIMSMGVSACQSRMLAHIYRCAARFVSRRVTSCASHEIAESDLLSCLSDISSYYVNSDSSYSTTYDNYATSHMNARVFWYRDDRKTKCGVIMCYYVARHAWET